MIGFLNQVISDISVEPRETTLTICALTDEPVSMESEVVRVVSFSTKEISKIIRLDIQSSAYIYLNPFLHIYSFQDTKEKGFRKILWKKVKLLKMSNFTFFHNVFYPIFIF